MRTPKQLANLRKYDSNQDREAASINGKKGGVACGIARRKRKALREELSMLLSTKVIFEGKERTMNEAISLAVIKRAMDGDPSAFKIIRETLGEDTPKEVKLQTQIEAISFGDMPAEQIATFIADAQTD